MPAEIVEPGVGNRPIAFPYNKLMEITSVNQGAVFIVWQSGDRPSARCPRRRVVYVWPAPSANESEEPWAAPAWNRPPEGMRVTLERVLQVNGIDAGDLHHGELYSCSPACPRCPPGAGLAGGEACHRPRRPDLRWRTDRQLHGHAVVAMVQALRREGRNGLLFGNGGYCTHNHAIVISRIPPSEGLLGKDYHYQAEARGTRRQLAAHRRRLHGAGTAGPTPCPTTAVEIPAMAWSYPSRRRDPSGRQGRPRGRCHRRFPH